MFPSSEPRLCQSFSNDVICGSDQLLLEVDRSMGNDARRRSVESPAAGDTWSYFCFDAFRVFARLLRVTNAPVGAIEYFLKLNKLSALLVSCRSRWIFDERRQMPIGVDVACLLICYDTRRHNNDESAELIDSDCSMTNAVKPVNRFGLSLESICPRTSDATGTGNRPVRSGLEFLTGR